jgi:hypothetical protein
MRNLQNFIPSKRSEKFFNVDKEKTNEWRIITKKFNR